MNPVDAMATCTARILAGNSDGPQSVGTGFFYSIPVKDGEAPEGLSIPFLVTNKHVLGKCDRFDVVLTVTKKGTPLNELGRPSEPEYENFQLPISSQTRIDHPSDEVDLCAVLIGPILNHLESQGRELHHFILGPALKLTNENRRLLRTAEPITMVGYPNGLWDEKNNAPIIRRGITATHPLLPYAGKKIFMIDAACFQGSSGSPVFIHEDGMFRSGENSYSPGTKIGLIGVLYAGPQFTVEGELLIKPIPHGYTQAPVTNIPMNLGYVISADELDVLTETVRKHAVNHS